MKNRQDVRIGTFFILFFALLLMHGKTGTCEEKDPVAETTSMNDKQTLNDLSLLPRTVQEELRSVMNKYQGPKEEILRTRDIDSKEIKGNSEIIQASSPDGKGNEKIIFVQNAVKDVCFRDDKGNGFDISYYADGRVSTFIKYQAGKPHGAFVKFHKNGRLHYQAECHNGKFIGEAKRWDESGTFVEAVNFKEPQDFVIEF